MDQNDSRQVLQLTEFMNYFKGAQKNFGEHIYTDCKKGEKEKGKSQTVTNTLLTGHHYTQHLLGKKGLGIIPINEDNKCFFSVIDIDIYDKNLNMYCDAINKNNLPLIIFKSKSGGLHIYLFYTNAIDASTAIKLSNRFASILTLDLLVKKVQNKVVEIFPKQSKIRKGSVGNFINLPYYNAKDTNAYAINDGKKLNLDEALILIKKKRVSDKDAESFLNELQYNDAPPCLQTIYMLNPLQKNSGRNEYLFSFGVYLKKKDENFFEQNLFEVNMAMEKPLDRDELERTIVSSLRKKDYTYKCHQSPCLDYCNKKECKKREYGLGKQDGYFSNLIYGLLVQLKTSQPYYEWSIKLKEEDEFKVLRFKNEDEIIRQDVFLRLCFRELRTLPFKMKQSEWFKLVNQHLQEMEVKDIDEQEEGSPVTLFKAYFWEFLLARALAREKSDLLHKRVYFDISKNSYLFRTADLYEYLTNNKQFRYFESSQSLHALLRDMKATTTRTRVSKKQFHVVIFPQENIPEHALIQYAEFKPDFNKYKKEIF